MEKASLTGSLFCFLKAMKYILTISFMLLLACNSRQQQGFAHITERRQDTSGQLVIRYRFYAGETWIQDSAIIANQVLPHDSVKLVFTPENPKENHLLLPWKSVFKQSFSSLLKTVRKISFQNFAELSFPLPLPSRKREFF
jgi:hypothetical protein